MSALNKFMIQVISRYQDSLPVVHKVYAQENYMNETVACELLTMYDSEMHLDEAEQMLRGKKCWCIWGEEDDIILSLIE